MKDMKGMTWEIWKDNGDGIYLFVFDASAELIWGASYNDDGKNEQLMDDLTLIKGGENPDEAGWEYGLFEDMDEVRTAHRELVHGGAGESELFADDSDIYFDANDPKAAWYTERGSV